MSLLQIPGLPSDSIAADISERHRDSLETLKTLSFDDLINKLANDIVQFAIHLAIAILVFYVGKFVIGKIYKITHNIMVSRNVDTSLTTFVLSLIRIVLYFILIVTVIGILGIETSSFIALFASAGVAIGMALSGTLQNFAGGVLILLLKPYRVGDYIETQGYSGAVTEIQIFNTIISTADNKSIIIPNGGLSTGTINNWSREDYRRIDWNIGISYGGSVERVRRAVLDMFAADSRIVSGTLAEHRESIAEQAIREAASGTETAAAVAPAPEPRRSWLYRVFHRSKAKAVQAGVDLQRVEELARKARLDHVDRSPSVNLSNLGDSAVELVIRAWAPTADYWTIYFMYLERFYNELPDAAGVSFPFPQLDVHLPERKS